MHPKNKFNFRVNNDKFIIEIIYICTYIPYKSIKEFLKIYVYKNILFKKNN